MGSLDTLVEVLEQNAKAVVAEGPKTTALNVPGKAGDDEAQGGLHPFHEALGLTEDAIQTYGKMHAVLPFSRKGVMQDGSKVNLSKRVKVVATDGYHGSRCLPNR